MAQHGLGQRQAAQESLARCRQLQSLHRDPVVHTVTSILSARLAIEAGMHQGGSIFYMTPLPAQGLQSNLAQAEAWSLALELAIHSSDGQSAQIAFSSYGVDGIESPTDNWPAVMARWFWLTGDLNRAAVATDSAKGPSHLCVRAERARILLLQKQDQDAIECAESLISESEQMGASDLLLFGRLVRKCGQSNLGRPLHAPFARIQESNGYTYTSEDCIWMRFGENDEARTYKPCFEASKGEAMTLDIDYIWPSRKAMTGSSLPRSRGCPRYAPGVHNDWKKVGE